MPALLVAFISAPRFEKFPNNRKVARGTCPHQSCCSCFVPRIDRSLAVQKQVHDLDAAQHRGQSQGRLPGEFGPVWVNPSRQGIPDLPYVAAPDRV